MTTTEEIIAAVPVESSLGEFDQADQGHVLTPANLMTSARPVIGGFVAHHLATGNHDTPLIPPMVALGVSDAEGQLARGIDWLAEHGLPWFKGYGCSELGLSLDPIADSVAFLEVATAAMAAPDVSRFGKVAVAQVLAAEGVKVTWAVRANSRHRTDNGGHLSIQPSPRGKGATFAKFVALTAAVGTHDAIGNPKLRTRYGLIAVGAATLGGYHGEKARREYQAGLVGNN